jgi:hypothetical protein
VAARKEVRHLAKHERSLIAAARWLAVDIWVKGNKPSRAWPVDHGDAWAAAWASRFEAWGIQPGNWQEMAERLAYERAPEFQCLPREVSFGIELSASLVWIALDLLVDRGANSSEAVNTLMKGEHKEAHAAIRKAYDRRVTWEAIHKNAQASDVWKPVKTR